MKKLSTTIIGVACSLLLSGCGLTTNEDSDRYALLESRIAELKTELQNAKDTPTLGTEGSLTSENPKTEQGIVMLTPVEPSPTPEPDDYALPYYSSVEELVELYRSGEWSMYQMRQRRDGNLFAAMSSYGYIQEGEFDDYGYKGRSTGIYPDLPDGYTPDDYIDYLHDFWGDGWFYCLETDGVHVYGCGQEKAFYPVDGVTEESTLISFFRIGECINTGSQIINYQTDGGYSIFLDDVIDLRTYDGGSTEIIMFHDDGEIQYYGNYRNEDRSYTITKTATAVACTEYGLNVVFTDVDSYTYIVDLDDLDTELAIEAGDMDVLHQYCLGGRTRVLCY